MVTLIAFNKAKAQSENHIITGKILNAVSQTPIAGISIQLRLCKKRTVTNSDGTFKVQMLTKMDTIDISSLAYEYIKLPISARTEFPITIFLTPRTRELESVIVNTGYQKIAKERATGSFTTIGKSLYNQQTGTTVLDRLESISNGLYFDRQTSPGVNIVIRGLSTIQGPRSPLIILDDFPYEGDLNNINPNDVENITILKDAAAASIWGTRAGNGVIVITTKRGKYEQPIRVDFNSNITTISKPDLDNNNDISSTDFIGVERFLYGKGFYNAQLSGQPWLAVSTVVELLNQVDLGNISAMDAESQIAALRTHSLKEDLRKYIYKTGHNLQQAITVSGGSKNIAWNIGGGWDHNADVLNAKYDRINFKTNQSFRLAKKLEINTGIDYTQSANDGGRLGFRQLRPKLGYLPVYTQLVNEQGQTLPTFFEYRQYYTDTAGSGKLLNWNWYPIEDNNHIHNSTNLQAVLANIGASYSLLKSLSLNVKYQYGKQTTTNQNIYDVESYYTRNLINSFSSIDPISGELSYGIPLGGIGNDANLSLVTQNIRGQINYSKKWVHHEINSLLGSEYRQINADNYSYRAYGFNPDILLSSNVNYTIPHPNYLSGVGSYIPEGTGYSGTLNRYVSFFGNTAYTYNGKYILSFSGRRDASNLFGATSNNRWTPLWSAGLGWEINKEKFYTLKSLPQLKLRATYGTSGNADPLRSAVTTLQFNSISRYTQLPIARISQFENRGLSWERVSMLNLGIDFSLKASVSGSIEYYHKKGTNLFGTSPVDYTALAFNSVIKNVASIAGHGFDISLNSNNLTGQISWRTQLNLNFNKDKVINYYLTDLTASNFTLGSSISAIRGRPVFGLYDYKWAGLNHLTGDPLGYVNGSISKNYDSIAGPNAVISDLKYIGPTLPTTTLSLGNTVSWQGLSLTIRIIGKFGNYFQRPSIDYYKLYTNRVGHSDFALRWQKPGDENHTNIPSMVYPLNPQREIFYASSEILASKADLIRLQYITFSYQIKKPAIQLYLNLNNLGLLWTANKYGIDPEYYNGLPPSKNYALGLKATF